MPPAIVTRRAGVDDVDTLLAHVQAGFDTYVEFAPLGWQPPRVTADRERSLEFLADPATWALLACVEERPVGHVAFLPARELVPGEPRASPLGSPRIPGLAHFWQLFVVPGHWGSGVAPLLHDAAIAEMRAQGYARARLHTPSRQRRARRFYEGRGWAAAGEKWFETLGLMVTEYRAELG